MLTVKEIDALALELLSKAIQIEGDWAPPRFYRVDKMDSGELVPAFSGTAEGYGSFLRLGHYRSGHRS